LSDEGGDAGPSVVKTPPNNHFGQKRGASAMMIRGVCDRER